MSKPQKSKKTINSKALKALNPCAGRYKNYLTHYKEREFSPAQFMGLKNITHGDKMWAGVRLLSKENLVRYAGEVACTTLYIYEAKYPSDLRPRKAAEMARDTGAVDTAALERAWQAKRAAADAAAYAAAHAAYVAAYAAAHAAYAAAYAVADAAYAAAYAASAAYAYAASAAYAYAYAADAANAAAYTRSKQEKLNRTIMIKFLKKEGYK